MLIDISGDFMDLDRTERLELLKIIFSQVQTLFDQIKEANTHNTKILEEISDILIDISNKFVSSNKDVEYLFKDISKDFIDLKSKMLCLSESVDNIESLKSTIKHQESLIINISNNLSKIERYIWKLIISITISFTLGLSVLGVLLYFQYSLSDLIKILSKIP